MWSTGQGPPPLLNGLIMVLFANFLNISISVLLINNVEYQTHHLARFILCLCKFLHHQNSVILTRFIYLLFMHVKRNNIRLFILKKYNALTLNTQHIKSIRKNIFLTDQICCFLIKKNQVFVIERDVLYIYNQYIILKKIH